MPAIKLKVARIGISRGVRLPAASLKRYRIGDAVLMEERSDGILLRPMGSGVQELSWEETARAMAASNEDWSEWETAVSDGLDVLNRHLDTVTVCPLTSQLNPTWRSRLQVRCGGRPSEVAVDQIRTVSKARVGARIGSLGKVEAAALRRVITEMYGE
jgi:mRNA interferase MazF